MSRTRPIFPVALSIECRHKALKVPPHFIRDAIFVHGTLKAFRPGSNQHMLRITRA